MGQPTTGTPTGRPTSEQERLRAELVAATGGRLPTVADVANLPRLWSEPEAFRPEPVTPAPQVTLRTSRPVLLRLEPAAQA